MASAKPVIHARDHRPSGSDPLDAIFFNYFNDSGDPGFLDVTTHNYTSFVNDGDGGSYLVDSGTAGVAIQSSSQLQILNAGGTGGINMTQSGGSTGITISDSSSDGLYLDSGNVMDLTSFGGMTLLDADGGIHLNATYTPTDFSTVTSNAVGILAGGSSQQGVVEIATFDVGLHKNYVWWGSVLFPNPPGSGLTFHGITAQITHSTQTFTVVDSGGFPILRVDHGGSVHVRAANPTLVADL